MGDDDAKRIILARRARFVRAALTSAGLSAAAVHGCGGETEGGPRVCLEPSLDGSADADAEPQPCLGALPPDAGDAEPQPCLEPPLPDAGDAAFDGNVLDADAEPQPCLEPPLPDAAPDADAEPQPCLSAPFDGG